MQDRGVVGRFVCQIDLPAVKVLSFSGYFLQVPSTACRRRCDMDVMSKKGSWSGQWGQTLTSEFTAIANIDSFTSISSFSRSFVSMPSVLHMPLRLLAADELQGYDLVLGPTSSAEDRLKWSDQTELMYVCLVLVVREAMPRSQVRFCWLSPLQYLTK